MSSGAIDAAVTFTAEVPDQIRWPEGCCVCGKPATRTVEARLVEDRNASLGPDMAVRLASLGTARLVEKHTFSVQVPHCQEHDDGAALHMVT